MTLDHLQYLLWVSNSTSTLKRLNYNKDTFFELIIAVTAIDGPIFAFIVNDTNSIEGGKSFFDQRKLPIRNVFSCWFIDPSLYYSVLARVPKFSSLCVCVWVFSASADWVSEGNKGPV